MNWTVGPHPSRVYWRRRIVLIAPVLIILFTLVSCLVSRGSDGGEARLAGVPSSATAQPSPASGSVDVGSAEPDPTESGNNGADLPAPAAASVSTTCADTSLALSAVPSNGTVRIGSFAAMHLLVKNSSSVACMRDLGSAQQELRIISGTTKVWSSDDCSTRPDAAAAASVRKIQPGGTFDFYIKWGGTTSSTGCVTGAPVTPGKYSLVARLGTLESKPAAFTVTK